MIRNFINKKNIPIIINLSVVFFLFCIILNYQQYSFLYKHDSALYYGDTIPLVSQRIPETLIYYFTNIIFPKAINVHYQDFKSSYCAWLISFIYILICFLFTKIFFVIKNNPLSIIKQKNFSIIYCTVFLLLSYPVSYLYKQNEPKFYFLWIDEVLHFYEYFLGYLFLIPFFIIIFSIVTKETKVENKFLLFLLCICGFLSGFWNEVFALTTFFFSCLLIIGLFIYDKKLLKSKDLIAVLMSAILGSILFFVPGDHFSHKYDLFGLLSENLARFPIFIQTFFKYLFVRKNIFWSLILFLSILLYFQMKYLNRQNNKQFKNILIICYSILFGYLTTCFLEIFGYKIISDIDYCFMREFDNLFFNHLFIIVILILLSGIYYNSNNKITKIINTFFLLIITIFSFLLIKIYPQLQDIKHGIKIISYEIEKTNLVYSILGESPKIKKSYNNDLLKFKALMFSFGNSKYSKLIYVDPIYSGGYHLYFKYLYKIDFLGFSLVDDNIAKAELEKRLKIFNDKMETKEELNKTGIKFQPLKTKFADKSLSLEDIERLEKIHKNSEILLKAKAYINYKNGNYSEALNLYNKYLEQNPDDFDALINTGKIYKNFNEYDKAKEIYQKLSNLDKYNLDFKYQYLKILYDHDKNYEEALKICNELIKIQPD
ncbi:MAG: DUF6056 family protein, partial [Candidatus Avigastranaerophilus sp.]